jgi:hypothetical protein
LKPEDFIQLTADLFGEVEGFGDAGKVSGKDKSGEAATATASGSTSTSEAGAEAGAVSTVSRDAYVSAPIWRTALMGSSGAGDN